MSRFRGDHYCKIDSKGRILFPAKLKRQMPPEAKEVFIGKLSTFENSLILYPENIWSHLVERTLRRLNPYNAQHDQFRRNFFRDVIELEFDSAGRILLPRRFLEFLHLDPGTGGEVVLAGQGDWVELMSKERYLETELNREEKRILSEDVMGTFTWDD